MTSVIKDTFKNTYKDDYRDSDNYYKILFNNARSLQQRELNQMQSIITNDIAVGNQGMGYKNGTAGIGGGVTSNNKISFIKLTAASNTIIDALLKDMSSLKGVIFTESGTNVKFRVDNGALASGSEKATLFVTYTDGGSGSGTANSGTKVTDGNVLTSTTTVDGGTVTLQSFSGGGTADPTTGLGCIANLKEGKFYIDGHFVHSAEQNIILSKYTTTPDANVGIIVSEDIITSAEDNQLFDNSGATLNTASPGADRYKITLTFTTKTLAGTSVYYISLAEIVNGQVHKQLGAFSGTSPIGQGIANLVKSAEGDFTVGKMLLDFQTNRDSASRIDISAEPGKGFVDGEYFSFVGPSKVSHLKPRTTASVNNASIAISYGNYVIASNFNSKTLVDKISTYDIITLKNAVTWGSTTIGTARIRAVEPYTQNGIGKYKVYLFDIKMGAGYNFGQTKSMGVSTTDFFNVQQDNGVAEIKDIQNNNLFMPIPYDRPASLADITITTNRIIADTTANTGNVTLAQNKIGGSGNTYTNTSSWIINIDSDGTEVSSSITSIGTPGATTAITGGSDIGSTALALSVFAQKEGAVAQKTLTTVTDQSIAQTTIDGKANSVSLGHADIYAVTAIKQINFPFNDITDRYIVDNGQRDNFYGVGKLILKGGATAPTGNVKVTFQYFTHGTGDFFAKGSYDGQINYEDIPSHTQANGDVIQLRSVLDFRSRKANAADAFSGTGSNVIALPKANTTLTADIAYYLGVAGVAYIHKLGYMGVDLSAPSINPQVPKSADSKGFLKLATFQINPYMVNDEDLTINYIDNRGYKMKDVARLERRVDELEEVVAMNSLELATTAMDILDSSGVNRLKSGITTDNFQNQAFSDTTAIGYKAAIDPSKNELRPEFIAQPIELVFSADSSTGLTLVGDKIMLTHTHLEWKTQPVASRQTIVNPFPVQTIVGNIEMSPASDLWIDTEVLPARIIKGDNLLDLSLTKQFGNWDFNWSGVNVDELADHKAGYQVGEKDWSGTYSTETTAANGAITTNTYKKNVTQGYYISSISSVREATGVTETNIVSKPYMRSRYISFKATGLRPNTEYFAFFDGVSVANYVDCDPGVGSFVRMGSLARGSKYLEVGNTLETTASIPSGATASKMSDANGALSGYFLLPRNLLLKFSSGSKIFQLQDTSKHTVTGQNSTYTSIASFIFTSEGTVTEIENEYRETRKVQITEAENIISQELLSSIVSNPYSGGNAGEGEPPDADGDGVPDHLDDTPNDHDGKRETRLRAIKNVKDKGGFHGGTTGGDTDWSGGYSGNYGGYDGSNCFVAGTMVEMADGTTKAIETIDIGEETRGGVVISTMKNLPEKIWDYKVVKVSGSHYVMEDGQFVTVGNSKHGVETENYEVVYNLIVSKYRIFIEGIEFGAYYTQDPETYADWEGGMARLNAELKDKESN